MIDVKTSPVKFNQVKSRGFDLEGSRHKKSRRERWNVRGDVVGVPGFEPGASWTRTKRDTKLRHTPKRQNLL